MVDHLELRVGGLTAELRFREHRVVVDATQAVRCVVGQVLDVRRGQRGGEEAQARFNLACGDGRGAGVEGMLHVERPVDAHVEHVHPRPTAGDVTQGEHEGSAHGSRCKAEGHHRPVDPDVIPKIEDAVVGARAFERGRQVGRITHVEDDAGGRGPQVHIAGDGDAGVRPSFEPEHRRDVGLRFEFVQGEVEDPTAVGVDRGREVHRTVDR